MADLIEGADVGLDLARRILEEVALAAEREGLRLSAVVADRAGNPVASIRMDGAPLGSYAIAADKAFSSAVWNDRTGAMGEIAGPGGEDYGIAGLLGGRMVVFAGGVPVRAGTGLQFGGSRANDEFLWGEWREARPLPGGGISYRSWHGQ